jgi:hypothetical protein
MLRVNVWTLLPEPGSYSTKSAIVFFPNLGDSPMRRRERSRSWGGLDGDDVARIDGQHWFERGAEMSDVDRLRLGMSVYMPKFVPFLDASEPPFTGWGLYGCGLRISEAAALEVTAIDKANRLVRIIGKGNKERQVPIPRPVLAELTTLWLTHRNPRWLCPNRMGTAPVHRKVLWHTVCHAAAEAGITRHVTPRPRLDRRHDLRLRPHRRRRIDAG